MATRYMSDKTIGRSLYVADFDGDKVRVVKVLVFQYVSTPSCRDNVVTSVMSACA